MAKKVIQKIQPGHIIPKPQVKKKVNLEVKMVLNKKKNGFKIKKRWIHEVIEDKK